MCMEVSKKKFLNQLDTYEAIIIGCGLSGGVIGRFLAEEKNKKVIIVERRNHIAGNMYDYIDDNGILVQKYGPHVFHTNKKELYDYLCSFSEWNDFFVNCMVKIDDKFTPSPFNYQTIDDFYNKDEATELKKHIEIKYKGIDKVSIIDLLNSDDSLIKKYANFLFSKDYSLYTAKQWGISPSEIDKSVLKRVPVLFSYKNGYFDDSYQKMPVNGFTSFFTNLITHENIGICLETDILEFLDILDNKIYINNKKIDVPIIYTGAVDELLRNKYGALPYRSLYFDIKSLECESYQEAPIVAYPQVKDFTRITEFTKMPKQKISGKTVIAVEYPQKYIPSVTEPYYPILTRESVSLYKKYQMDIDKINNLYLCGRLADFKYYNMDQTLENAIKLCNILDNLM